jgi:hypothetical protein
MQGAQREDQEGYVIHAEHWAKTSRRDQITEIEELMAAKAYREKELQFAQKLFEKHFGLKFLRDKRALISCCRLGHWLTLDAENDVRLVFTQIDPRATSREFYCTVHIDKLNKYHGVETFPPLILISIYLFFTFVSLSFGSDDPCS